MSESQEQSQAPETAEGQHRPPINSIVGRVILTLVGLFQIGVAIFYFGSQFVTWGAIGRLDMAAMMIVAAGLGFCLVVRPSKVSLILSLLMYGVFLAKYLMTEPVDVLGLVLFGSPPILLFVGGVLYAQRPNA